MKHFILFSISLLILLTNGIKAQTTNTSAAQPNNNPQEKSFYEIQKSFYDHWAPLDVVEGYYYENGVRVKAAGWNQFKRWEWYWENRVDPITGAFPNINKADIYTELKKQREFRSVGGTWTNLGPSSSTGGQVGLGRLNCVAFRPGDNNTYYTGSPNGGLWKTIDNGTSWIPLTDNNAVLGVSAVVVIAGTTPATDTIFIGTGDRDGGSMWSMGGGQQNDNNGIGILKSVDGGTTWVSTGLSFAANEKVTVNEILKDPLNDNILYAATSDIFCLGTSTYTGFFKSVDAGASWTKLSSNMYIDLEFKPGDSQTIYGSTKHGNIFRSDDAGVTWTSIFNNRSAGGARIEITVSLNQPTWLYAVEADSTTYKLFGVYKSTDSGASFSIVYDGSISNHNLLGSINDGSSTTGQGQYDLAIAVSQTNANTIFLGGINTFRSTDGGTSWTSVNCWTSNSSINKNNAPVVHSDKHDLIYRESDNYLFECNDGGIFYTSNNGSSWPNKTNGISPGQIYRLGVSQTAISNVITGHQDDGTKLLNSGTWSYVLAGDGMEGIIDYTDDEIQYGCSQYGRVARTTDRWYTGYYITKDAYGNPMNGLNETGYWITPYVIDPNDHSTLYLGLNNVWKTTNKGGHWTKISSMNSSDRIRSVAVAPSHPGTVYAADPTHLWVTTNDGTSWTDITGTLPVGSCKITYISIKDDDDSTAWISMGEYNSDGVFETNDAGVTWTNISTGLPSIPIMCVIQNKQESSFTELYAGTDLGVYVKQGAGNWAAFNTGLPNVVVPELEIYYDNNQPANSRLRAATFGRGLWDSDLYGVPSSEPSAGFLANKTTAFPNDTITFTDLSTNSPTSWQWNISPSTFTYINNTTGISQNPMIIMNDPGSYSVQLIATNAHGADTLLRTDYITVSTLPDYCTASGGGDEYISGVQLGTIDNTGTGSDGHHDYTALSTTLIAGQTYDITITNGHAYNGDDLGVWIDWNKDGDFYDTDENVICWAINNVPAHTIPFTVPSFASPGYMMMRVRIKYYNNDCGYSCGATSYGEVEDYTIKLIGLNTWQGTSSQWDVAANWSEGKVPTSFYNIVIPAGLTNYPTIVTNGANCNDLTIESDTSGDASLIGLGNLTVNGTATVNRYLTGGKWHEVSAMVAGATVNSFFFNHSPDVWMQEYDEPTDTRIGIVDLSTPMPLGKGFEAWVDAGNNVTAIFTGNINSEDAPTNITYSDNDHSFNLLGNPFSSAISWDSIYTYGSPLHIDNETWVWDPTAGNYRTFTGSGTGRLTDGIIPMGQGFFIHANGTNPSLSIPSQAQIHSTQPFYKSSGNRSSIPHITLTVNKGEKSDGVWIVFHEGSTEAYESGYDSRKMNGSNSSPQLYAVEGDEKFSIDALPPIDETNYKIVQLFFKAGESGEQTLIAGDLEMLPDVKVILEDLLLEKTQVMNSNPIYTFAATTYQNPDRFRVHFERNIVDINTKTNSSSIHIYSVNKNVYITCYGNSISNEKHVQIIDMMGRTIVDTHIPPGELAKIPVNASNNYIVVRVIGNGEVYTKKLLLNSIDN